MKLLSGLIELKPGWFVRLPYPMTEMEMARYRFDPVTLLIIGTSVMAAGQLQAGRVAEAQAESAQNIAEYNATVAEQQARAQRQRATFEQERQAKRAARIKSALTAQMGAAGGLGSLVASDLAAEQAAELELENLLIGYEGQVGAARAMSQAELDRLQGRMAIQRGKGLKQASYFQAGSTLLTGFGTAGYIAGAPAGGTSGMGGAPFSSTTYQGTRFA